MNLVNCAGGSQIHWEAGHTVEGTRTAVYKDLDIPH